MIRRKNDKQKIDAIHRTLPVNLIGSDGVAASKPKALGMADIGKTIPKLRLRLPPEGLSTTFRKFGDDARGDCFASLAMTSHALFMSLRAAEPLRGWYQKEQEAYFLAQKTLLSLGGAQRRSNLIVARFRKCGMSGTMKANESTDA